MKKDRKFEHSSNFKPTKIHGDVILRRCAVVGEPTYIVTLASNIKALKNK